MNFPRPDEDSPKHPTDFDPAPQDLAEELLDLGCDVLDRLMPYTTPVDELIDGEEEGPPR